MKSRYQDLLPLLKTKFKTVQGFVGFDGFIDQLIEVVDTRYSADEYSVVSTISDYAHKIEQAAGNSANFEFITKVEKPGGNGPIMSAALAALDTSLVCVGALAAGSESTTVHPIF